MKEENKLRRVINILQILIIIVSFILLITFRENNITLCYVSLILMMISNVIYFLKDIKRRIIFFLFNGSFFTFLMGKETIDLLQYGKVSYNFEQGIQFHIILSLYLSLLALQVGFILIEKFIKKEFNAKNTIQLLKMEIDRESFKNILRKYSKIIFIVGWIINIFISIEQIIYVANNSYLEFAKSFNSNIPYIIRIIGNFRLIAFFIFLATLPEKRETKPILILVLLESIISLLYGDRGNCIINTFIMFFYIVFRQWKNKEEKWISKKQVIIIIIIIPLLIAFLSFFVYFREGIDIGKSNILAQIQRFFKSMGNTVNILGFTEQYEQELKEVGSLYSLGDLKQYVIYNPITEILFGWKHAPYHTEEYALSGQSFMHTISYFINPTQYLEGHGKGSCYIAELNIDFGYTGVIIGNLLLGAYMAIFNKIYKKSYILTACLLLSYRIMFFIPRAPIIYIITYVFNFTAIASIMLIIFLTLGEIYIKRYRRVR